MNEQNKVKADAQLLREAEAQGTGPKLKAYVKLSGPGWLQSAITLGGGSLSSSLYLGVLAGFTLLWLQPFAMILGIIMLSAIGYVTMSTGERPFRAINQHVNPVLGWSWALACLAANMVWCLPQYALATGVMQQNLMPGLLGADGLGDFGGKLVIVPIILVVTTAITWSYGRGGLGIRLYELILKLMVAGIVLAFGSVVLVMAFSEEGLDWGGIFSGFIPNFGRIFQTAPEFDELLKASAHKDYWTDLILGKQRDVMVSAAATAVGINMTFLFPYTILKRGWGKEFRGLAKFDLCTGMLIPFLLATSCVVIASASQFHAKPQAGLLSDPGGTAVEVVASGKQKKEFAGMLAPLEAKSEGVSEPDRVLAATLVTRDAKSLASSLTPLTGHVVADIIFGFGVLGMALSTITLLMLISGFCICEMFNVPPTGWPFRLGTLAAATGALGPFFWSKAAFWLAMPTSVFGLTLLPLAYLTFFFLMNQKTFLGNEMPTGGRRYAWNVLMGISASIATAASLYMVWVKAGWYGIGGVIALTVLTVIVHFARKTDR